MTSEPSNPVRTGSAPTEVLADLVESFDWSTTPLGPLSTWPTSLRTTAEIVLRNRFPMALWWSDKLVGIYNDAYRPILGAKHPAALGRSAADVWVEIWDILGPQARQIMAGEPATWNEHLLLPMNRKGYVEETYFTFSYSPVPDESGAVGGLLVTCQETTREVQRDRQLATLRDLAAKSSLAKTAGDACTAAANVLSRNDADIPFALLYLLEGDDSTSARLVSSVGFVDQHGSANPATLFIAGDDAAVWPIDSIMRAANPVVIDNVAERAGTLPSGRWDEPPKVAIGVPFRRPGNSRPYGFMVAGASPRRELDEEYAGFFSLAADHIAAAVGNARAFEEQHRRAQALSQLDPLGWGAAVSDSTPPQTDPARSGSESRERILVADTNADMRSYVAGLLRERWLVETVTNGREVLAAIRRSPPDLLLSDEMMPDMDGIALLKTIRREVALKDIPLILLSARAGAEATAGGLRTEADDYLVKPFAARDLLVRVAARLAMAKAARDAARQRQGLYGAFMQAPFTFSILRGPDLVVEFANDIMLQAWGKGRDVIGLPFIEALPEIQGQPFVDLLLGVLRSGVAYEGRGEQVRLPIGPGGAMQDAFYNYVYAPLYDARGTVDGVFVAGFDTTEHVESRQRIEALASELRLTSERLQAAQRAGRIGIFDWDIASGRMHWSPELYLLLGLEPAAVEASPDAWTERLHENDREKGWEAFRHAVEARKDRFDVEVRLRQADDSSRWVRLSSTILYDDTGQPARLLGAAVDIEALRRAATELEGALRAKEVHSKMVATLFNEAPAPIALMRGPKFVIELLNPRCAAMWNRDSADELLGKPLLDALPELRGQGFEDLLSGVMATGQPFVGHEMPIGIRLSDGHVAPRFFNFVYAPITNGLGVIDGVSAIAFDATDAVLTRRELDRAKELAAAEVRSLVDNAPELAWTARPDGHIDFYNRRWYEYTGTTFDEMEGWGWSKVHDPKLLTKVTERWQRSLATGQHFEMEFPLRRHDGRFRWFLTRVSPLRDESGRIIRWFGSNTDIHELRETRERSAALLGQLEISSRAKDEFLATMSHELRTPLNAMLGWARLLKAAPRDSPQLEHGLVVIERNAQTQARLVDDLLDVSRIISGKLRLHMRKISVAAVVDAAVDVVRSAADAKRVQLLVNTQHDVGTTIADADRLQQIVWNLLTNAIRFTPAHGRITVGAHRVGSSLSLRVEDTGAGIAAQHLPHIFERFRQVDSSTTRAHGGLGLGLAIVRHLTEAHGGTVGVTSDGPGHGSVFTVTLPIRAVSTSDVASAEAEAEAEAAHSASPGAIIENVRILVVEDEPDSLELIQLVLEGAGAKVTTATSASAALDAPGPFDIIISDIAMPEMDGHTFMRRIRSRDEGATVPALALTAYARGEDADRAIRAGYQQHLSKPVDSSRLIEAVKTWARVPWEAR